MRRNEKTLMNKHLDVFPRGPESHPLEEEELGIGRRSQGRRDGLSGWKGLAVRGGLGTTLQAGR